MTANGEWSRSVGLRGRYVLPLPLLDLFMKLSAILVAGLLCAHSLAQQLVAPERNTRKVALFDAYDGSLIDDSFIDLTLGGAQSASQAVEAQVAPNGEVWVSMLHIGIQRFSNDGSTFLGQSSLTLTQPVHGFEIAYGSVWLTQGSSINHGNAQLLELDMNLDLVTAHPIPGVPRDAVAFEWNGVPGLLLSDYYNDEILFFDPANPGNLTVFHSSIGGGIGIIWPHQITIHKTTGNPVVGGGRFGWSGISELDAQTGVQLDYYNTHSVMGSWGNGGTQALLNGEVLTASTSVHTSDMSTHTSSLIHIPHGIVYFGDYTDDRIVSSCDPAQVSSSGSPVHIVGMLGSASGSGLHLRAFDGPANQVGYFLVGTGLASSNPLSVGLGDLCLSIQPFEEIGRYNVLGGGLNSIGLFDADGVLQNVAGTSSQGLGFDVPADLPFGGAGIVAGSTWHFQLWFRDGTGGQTNFSNSLSVTF